MRYAILCFMTVIMFCVLTCTIRGLAKRDFSASGMRITQKESPIAFWLTGAWHLAACGVVAYFLVAAIKKAFA